MKSHFGEEAIPTLQTLKIAAKIRWWLLPRERRRFLPVLQYIQKPCFQRDLVPLTVISINLSDIQEKHRSSHLPVNQKLTTWSQRLMCPGLEEYLGNKYNVIIPINVCLRQIHGQSFHLYLGTPSLNLGFQRWFEFQEQLLATL